MVYKLLSLFIALLVVVVLTALVLHANPKENKNQLRVAVVDVSKLVSLHPSFVRLKELDREMNSWESGRFGIAETLLSSQELAEWEKSEKEAETKWEADVHELSLQQKKAAQSIQGKSSRVDPKELALIQSALNQAYKEALGQRMRELDTAYTRQLTEAQKDSSQALQAYLNELLAFRNQRLSARQHELVEKAERRLKKHAGALQDEYVQFEKKLMGDDQSRKLDLQLKLSVADVKEKEDVENQLKTLEDREETEKGAKQDALRQDLSQFRQQQLDEVSKSMKATALTLDKEVQGKMNARRDDLFKASRDALKDEQNSLRLELADYKSKALDIAKVQVVERFRNRVPRSSIENLVASSQTQLASRLDADRLQIEAKLHAKEEQILAHSETYRKATLAIKQGKRQIISEVLHDLAKEKDRVLLSIREDIMKQAQLIAKQEGIEAVLTNVAMNINARDLTDDIAKRLHP